MCVDNTLCDIQSFHHHHWLPHQAPTFQKLKTLTEAWLKTVSSVCCWIFALCWVCEPEVWHVGILQYMFARSHMGAKEDQSMLSAPHCVFYKEFGFIPCCVFWVSRSRLLLWKYLCQKQGHTININTFISMVITLTVELVYFLMSYNSQNAMLFGVLVL